MTACLSRLPAVPAGRLLATSPITVHSTPTPRRVLQGLSDKADRCKFYVYPGNRGNGITACEGDLRTQ